MDTLQFDPYASYSDSSTPRTPSPHASEDLHHFAHSPHYKPNLDMEPLRNLFTDNHPDDPVDAPFWSSIHSNSNGANGVPANPFSFHPSSRSGSLLQELYDDHAIAPDQQISSQHVYMDPSPDSPFSSSPNDWPNTHLPHSHHSQSHHHHQPRSNDYPAIRRATFPYVRHDREDGVLPTSVQHQQQQHQQHQPQHQHHPSYPHHQPSFISPEHQPILANPFASRTDTLYGEPISVRDRRHHSLNVRLEDPAPVVASSQAAFYRSPSQSSSSCHSMGMSYLSPHTGLPVQHTDDAASKETQYLRRRCFNCHTTEPPSWRRSTLNPGKIVCNKCGLYERTHLRPRPLRFDELRAGNKARKQQGTKAGGTISPKPKLPSLIKKESRDMGPGSLVRRCSTSSSTSSAHSVGTTSDWDDTGELFFSTHIYILFRFPWKGEFCLQRDPFQCLYTHPQDLPRRPLTTHRL